MTVQLVEHLDPGKFCASALPALLEREAENCSHLGLVSRMATSDYSPVSADELARPLLLTVQKVGRVELVAIQTLKTKMLVSRGSVEAMRCLGDGLAERHWTGESIIGVSPSVATLAEHYAKQSGRRPQQTMRLRTFQLTRVAAPSRTSGSMRLCTPADRHIVGEFFDGFAAEIGEPSDEASVARAGRLIESQRLFFWIDEAPVAMAGWAGRTPHGVRINSVYTPPQFRGRGYASNLVAGLTQRMLDEGRQFCFLHTDQANPTSNRIYEKIGYRPVCDCEEWRFGHVNHDASRTS